MDDTFVLFHDKYDAPLFLNYLSRQHSSINFTMETEENCSLSFLDVDIKRNKNKFSTNVYRKPTFSGLGLIYFCFCHRIIILIRGSMHRKRTGKCDVIFPTRIYNVTACYLSRLRAYWLMTLV